MRQNFGDYWQETGIVEKNKKIWKNLLTKDDAGDIISKLSARAGAPQNRQVQGQKKVWKNQKKFLTKDQSCGMIIPAAESERRAPCKLNNVTNTKHQKDWLLK